ncbi:hypothetical protein DTL21_14030 [Bremerella cremea]|uniref:Uncharacterized protein n=1 Tax=Blastopirellula marina TaxID=124 RepID=A0A2S8FR20_9BACT|nr:MULTISPECIES: hypothetical protein [Pirellulaceae]PQO34623.1 hypothetical protein C5Y83_14025 [Blastopirellula marina]RCS47120.1 hypothetical protein DTL21_14030 [Bremerella cremea]
MTKRYEITHEHWQAAMEVPKQIALDASNTPSERLRAAKLVQTLLINAWEDENQREQLRLLALATEPVDPVVREDENFYGNNAHQLIREKEARDREAWKQPSAVSSPSVTTNSAPPSSIRPYPTPETADPHPLDIKLGKIKSPVEIGSSLRQETEFVRRSFPCPDFQPPDSS